MTGSDPARAGAGRGARALVGLAAPLLASLLLSGPGCAMSKTAGQRGALAFGVAGSDLRGTRALDGPLAEGEQLELTVYTPKHLQPDGSHIEAHDDQRRVAGHNVQEIKVARASSSSPEIVEVVGVEGSTVRLRGRSTGTGRITVETWAGADVLPVEVQPLGYVEIDHPRWSEALEGSPARSVLLAGGTVSFEIRRRGRSGAPLYGYGVASSVTLWPADAAEVVGPADALKTLRLRPAAPGRLALQVASGTSLAFDVVSADAVDSIALRAFELDDDPPLGAVPRAREGEGRWLLADARTADGRQVLGLGGALEVVSQTPEICALWPKDAEPPPDDGPRALMLWPGDDLDGPFAVFTPTAGTCTLSAQLGDRSFETRLVVSAPTDAEPPR